MNDAVNSKLILDYIYDREQATPDRVYLTQPLGGGQVVDYSWAEVLRQARCMASYIEGRGFAPGSKIAILSKNCAWFFMAELAIWMAGCTTVSIFPTENAETIRYVLEHSESKMIFLGKLDEWELQSAGVPEQLERIVFPLAPAMPGLFWDVLVASHSPMSGRPERQAKDLAMLVYTSGSTGQPKGVMHHFEGITRALEAISLVIESSDQDRYISYLPLAHVVERAFIECNTFINGGHIFFAESLTTFISDVQRARPTVFLSVPRLWLKFQGGVFAKMSAGKLDLLLRLPVINKIIGKKILTGLGLDQVRLAGSGSAPIPASLIQWYRRLGLNLLEGYAMTEDFACSHLSSAQHSEVGFVGVPCGGVEVRIGADNEIQIKSPGQMAGYFKQPELDRASLTEDGFFCTGDQGMRRPDGMLKITGRIKELFKTGKGKYVAPAPIENRLNASPLIEMSMVSGVGEEAAYALILLAEEQRALLSDPVEKARIEAELGQLLDATNAALVNYEQLRMLVVIADPWSIENGCLTPTMKIKRSRIEARVSEQVAAWYAMGNKVQWI